MISFIIIGRNEGWKLTQAIQSIFDAIKIHNLKTNEVIYVDSSSTDDSISRAEKFAKITILQLHNSYNAAIARNAGVAKSRGDWLFFIDGDMQLNPEFIKEFIKLSKAGHEFISGQLLNNYYNDQWKLLKKAPLFNPSKLDIYDVTNGGAFIISRKLWDTVNGMRNKYDYSQDIDLNYRLVRKGIYIWRSSKIYADHHTLQYNFDNSLKNIIKTRRRLLFRGLLLRDHLLNTKILKRSFRINYSAIILFISFLPAIFVHPAFILLYVSVLIGRSTRNYMNFRKVIKSNYFLFLLKYLSIDLLALTGFLFFYPGNKKAVVKVIKPV